MRIIVLITILSSSLFAQMGEPKNRVLPKWVKNQKHTGLHRIPQYLTQLPKAILDCGLHYLKGSDYNFLLNQAGTDAIANILKYSQHRRLPTTENQFSFGYGEVDEVCEHQFGFCRGYTSSIVLTSRMLFFDQINFLKQKVPSEFGSKEWHQFYFKLIDKLMNKRDVVVIPGFNNLYEFSDSTPHIKRYFKEHVAKMWARENINFSSFFKVFRSIFNKFDTTEAMNLHKNLSHKINKLGYNPTVFVTMDSRIKNTISMPNNAGIHVMQAYKVSEIDEKGIFKIHFWDVGTPHDARRASTIYKVSIKDTDKQGLVAVESNSGSSMDKRKQGDEKYNYKFADIEQVPFDDLTLGQDSVKMLDFFGKNPEFLKHLEAQYQERIQNPPKPFFPKYKGEMDSIPPLVLKDGSLWNWEKAHLNRDGQIHIDEFVIKDLPAEVKEVFKHFDRDWQKRNSIDVGIQKPDTLSYALAGSSKHYNYEWPLEWLKYDGSIKLPENYKEVIPKELQTFLDEAYLDFKPEQLKNPKFLSSYSRKVTLDDVGDVFVEMDFIDTHGNLYIPSQLEDMFNPDLKKFLVENDLWAVKKQIKMDRLQHRRSLESNGEKWSIPPKYYKDDNILIIPEGEQEKWPEWVKQIFCGYKPGSECPEKVNINDIHVLTLRFEQSDKIVKTVNLPFTWSKRYQGEATGVPDNAYLMGLKIPEEEIEHVPNEIRDIIVGVGGTFPPKNLNFGERLQYVVLKDGSNFYFPMSWIQTSFGPRSLVYTLNVPKSEAHIISKTVIDEIFSVGPIKLKTDQDIDISNIQTRVIWHTDPVTKERKPLILPREWMIKDGSIILPDQTEINKYFTSEEQETFKNWFRNFEPGQKVD